MAPAPLIRSVFDQYSQPENRLTHGLVQVLARDQRLTRDFIAFATGIVRPSRQKLSFACQRTPGDRPDLDDESRAEQRGVPDAWIYDDANKWALVIESKLGDKLTPDQLLRHADTARRRGFGDVGLLAITADETAPRWLRRSLGQEQRYWLPWARVFEFISSRAPYSNPVATFLGRQFLDYLRVVEARGMAGDKVLTTFTGIPFAADHPFNEAEARVVLRSLMRELRGRLASSGTLPVARAFEQKPLTGTWDVIGFTFAGSDPFTKHPHLTISIWEDTALQMTLPNGALSHYWRRLLGSSEELLRATLLDVVERRPRRKPVGQGLVEPRFVFEIFQQHFHARRVEIQDGLLRFDLDALGKSEGSDVKAAPGWLPSVQAVLHDSGRANLQVQLTARYPFSKESISHGPAFIDAAVEAAQALQPFLELLTGRPETSRPDGVKPW